MEEGNRAYLAAKEAWEKAQRRLTLRVSYPGEDLEVRFLPVLLGNSQSGVPAPASPPPHYCRYHHALLKGVRYSQCGGCE